MGIARILIVEDEILVAREIESHLEAMGYLVVGIELAAAGVLAQVMVTSPDLVFMDINLPGHQDGIVLAGTIRDRFQIPVVYITAYADPSTLARVKTTQPFGYVLKPFTATDLRIAVELALGRLQSEANPWPSLTTATNFSEQHADNPVSPDNLVAPQIDQEPQGLPPHKLRQVMEYIDAHLNQELSLEMLANEVGFTTSYFARLFKQSTHQSVHQYIIQRRVERAQWLLQESELTITQIAAECGFANPSHLALHFKRIVGVTPKKFRFF